MTARAVHMQGPVVRKAGHCDESGQATLEYLFVACALIAAVAGLGALAGYAHDGRFAGLVDSHASHAVSGPEGVADALLF